MKKGSIGKFALLALFMLVLLGARAQSSAQGSQDENNPPPKEPEKAVKKRATTKLHVVVTAGEDPISAAQVDVTSKEEGVTFSASARTDNGGAADLTVPRGKVLIQVVAQHWNASGVLRDLQAEKETVEIKLQ